MASDNLIFVPSKTTLPVDLESSLTKIITEEFYQPPSSYISQLKEINDLRSFLVTPKATIECITAIKRYYVQFSALKLKLPADCIEFSWFPLFQRATDGVDSSKNEKLNRQHPYTTKSLVLEQCYVLYVIGSLYSSLAREQNRYSSEGLKKAGVYYQYAAGCFQILDEDNLAHSLDEVPMDLTSYTLSALTYLMLASAQEIYWLKAVTDNLKDTVVSKLSMQTSEFYANSVTFMQRSRIFEDEWINFCRVKSIHFKAAALYRLAVYAGLHEKYGEQISRLRSCSKIVQEGLIIPLDNEKVKQDLTTLSKVVSEDLKNAERENDLIYLAIVPPEDSLPAPAKAVLVKPLILSELLDPVKALTEMPDYGEALFDKLIPYTVIQLAASFKERCLGYVESNIKRPIDVLNKDLETFLKDLNLDYELDSLLRPQSIPVSVHQYASNLKDMGGIVKLDSMLGDLSSLKLEARETLDSNWALFNRAEEDDTSLRALYGAKRWTLRPMKEEATDIIRNLEQFEQYLEDSKQGDETIYDQVDELRPFIEVFESLDGLDAFIPKAKVLELNPDLRRLIIKVRELLRKADQIKEKRGKFLLDVQKKVDSIDILSNVITRYRQLSKTSDKPYEESEYESVVDKELSKFAEDVIFISKTSKEQNQLVSTLGKSKVDYLNRRRGLKVSLERERALDVLSKTYHGYCEVIGNIKQGLGFYNDFFTNLDQTHNELANYLEERRHASVNIQNTLDKMDDESLRK
ncbi:hypothetical protein FOA43_004655 [Brettanomyces nanus]|uniref:BRO1 domain-containing protein n=1 Tax=Eeniella nana TaxID=13502 RepID=A0A875S8L8_EENNA|nr:uncharacterized protein FOA43_004655 [Brettanomyces nanus]QPG77248.1 hypothetical protein FOA43_004655 [Brettanomyces nanus]